MAASAWQLYNSGKRYIGNGTIQLGVNNFKMALFRGASNASTLTLSTFSQLSAQASGGAYSAGGKFLVPAAGTWTLSGSTVTFDYTTLGITFTAAGSSISAIQYAVIYNSAGKLLCFCQLSSSQFTVSSPNTLTVLPAATGVFTLT